MPRKPALLSKEMLTPAGSAPPKSPKDYGKPLNFRVPEDFFKSFKICAARRGLNQTELLMSVFAPVLKQEGDYE